MSKPYSDCSDWSLVRMYIMGVSPPNYSELAEELKSRGFDLRAFGTEIDAFVNRWSEMGRKPPPTIEDEAVGKEVKHELES